MPLLLQICVVIVTTALVAIAFATIRAVRRFEGAAEQFSQMADAIEKSVVGVQDVTREMHEVVSSLGEVAPRVHRIVARFETVGDRAAHLSESLLDQVEAPVRNAVAVAQGVRSGTAFLIDRLIHRRHTRSHSNGGYDHE